MSKAAIRIRKHVPSVLQGRLDFAGQHTFSLSVEHPAEPIVFRISVALVLFFLCAYLYFVSASVLNVMARKEALIEITKLQTSISTEEQQYFSLSQGVMPAAGYALGLTPIKTTTYVYRPGNTAAVTIRGNEI